MWDARPLAQGYVIKIHHSPKGKETKERNRLCEASFIGDDPHGYDLYQPTYTKNEHQDNQVCWCKEFAHTFSVI